VRNSEEESILDFVVAYDLSIVNSYFKKKEEHMVTFRRGNTRAHINFLFMRATNQRVYNDCKAIPSECLMMQHRLLVMDVHRKCFKRKKKTEEECKVKWLYLIREIATKLF